MSLNPSWAHCLHIFFFFRHRWIADCFNSDHCSLSLSRRQIKKSNPTYIFFSFFDLESDKQLEMWAQLIVCASTHSLLSVACLKYKSQALWMKSKTRSEWHSKTFEVFQRDEMKTSGAFEATIYELFYLKIRMFFILFFFIIYWLLTERSAPLLLTQRTLLAWCLDAKFWFACLEPQMPHFTNDTSHTITRWCVPWCLGTWIC